MPFRNRIGKKLEEMIVKTALTEPFFFLLNII